MKKFHKALSVIAAAAMVVIIFDTCRVIRCTGRGNDGSSRNNCCSHGSSGSDYSSRGRGSGNRA